MTPLKKEVNFGSVNTFHLMLGPECNMRCRHCFQTPLKKNFLSKEISDDSMQTLNSFIAFSQSDKYHVDKCTSGNPYYRLFFWGGEALLHWNLLKKIIKEMTERHNILSNHAFRFIITSNGLLLNDEMIKFMNEYEVYFHFSYDAPHPFAVRGKVPETICDKVKQIKYHKPLSTGSAHNCDPLLAYRCLKAKFPNAYNYAVGYEISRSFEMEEDIYRYDFDKIRENIRKICIAAKLGDVYAYRYLTKKLLLFKLNPQHNFHKLSGGLPNCIAGRDNFNLTLDGKITLCHNYWIPLGDVNDSLATLKEKALTFWEHHKLKECNDCRFIDICHGNCPFTVCDDNGGNLMCKEFSIPFYTILEEEVMRMTEPLTQDDISWYKKKEKEMDAQIQEFLLIGEKEK